MINPALSRRLGAALLLALGVSAPLAAQDEGPAVDTRRDSAATTEGTTIVGDRESPIGLFIMPWRDSAAQADLDRPARLLQADLLPIDEPVFVRQIEYHRALSGALKDRNEVSPDVPAPAVPTTP
jgi:hypothetical protein